VAQSLRMVAQSYAVVTNRRVEDGRGNGSARPDESTQPLAAEFGWSAVAILSDRTGSPATLNNRVSKRPSPLPQTV